MTGAVRGERVTGEALPSLTTGEAGLRGHLIELGREHVTNAPRAQAHAARFGDLDELTLGELIVRRRIAKRSARLGRGE